MELSNQQKHAELARHTLNLNIALGDPIAHCVVNVSEATPHVAMWRIRFTLNGTGKVREFHGTEGYEQAMTYIVGLVDMAELCGVAS